MNKSKEQLAQEYSWSEEAEKTSSNVTELNLEQGYLAGYNACEEHYSKLLEEKDKEIEKLQDLYTTTLEISHNRGVELSKAKELLKEANRYIDAGGFESVNILAKMVKERIENFLK